MRALARQHLPMALCVLCLLAGTTVGAWFGDIMGAALGMVIALITVALTAVSLI